ncbi:MAG: putative O-methyltransferase [Acidimicrobiales bacterium]|nr:putative O-methyltransferase [Acidimicrobiales bacterium]
MDQSDDVTARSPDAGHLPSRFGPGSPERLYLDLLERCLTRSGFEEPGQRLVPAKRWKRWLWKRGEQLLTARGVRVSRAGAPTEREEGRDWPTTAETMVGLRRLENLKLCIEQAFADGVPGDLIETGVWRGGSCIFMRGVLAALGDTERTVWVADSFEGLPRPNPAYPADDGNRLWTYEELAVSLTQVQANFAKYGLLDDQVQFLPGWFDVTLPAAPIEALAVLRLDGDMYGSTIDVLNALYPKLSVGGFAIIDDYGGLESCRQAVEDYRAAHAISERIHTIDWTGVYWRRER